jgi:cytochrome c oxidase subunit 2
MRRTTLAIGLLLAGCAGPQDFMRTAGPAAHGLARLGGATLLLLSAVSIVTWLLILWVAMRRRGTLEAHAPVDAGGGQRWILIGGVAIPVAVLAIIFIGTLETLSAFPMACSDAKGPGSDPLCATGVPQIRVTGQQWWFEAQYQFASPDLDVIAPTEIHVPVGRPVDIELATRDVIHSFWVPKLHGKVDLVPGYSNRIRIQADVPGTYQGECGEYCGAQHAKMRLQIVAQSQEAFQSWLTAQRAEAHEPTSEEAVRGKAVFERGACIVCHTVRGTAAQGKVGPDLTHVASRRYLAGGTLPNNAANLEAWVTHAQSLKPASRMPNITAFTGSDLRALVAYLQSLK